MNKNRISESRDKICSQNFCKQCNLPDSRVLNNKNCRYKSYNGTRNYRGVGKFVDFHRVISKPLKEIKQSIRSWSGIEQRKKV